MLLRSSILAVLLCLSNLTGLATIRRVLPQPVHPVGFDNDSFLLFYYHGDKIYTIKGMKLFENLQIDDLKLSPAKTSIATLQHNLYGVPLLFLYDINPYHTSIDYSGDSLNMLKQYPTALAYSANARQLAVSYVNRNITIYDVRNIKSLKTYTSNIVPEKVAFSDNDYFIGAAKRDTLEIWNLAKGVIRKTLKMSASVRDFCFFNNSANLMVLTADGKLHIYNTKAFELSYTINDLDGARTCSTNHTGKYAAFVVSDKLISVINVLDPTERHEITDEAGGITNAKLIYHESFGKTFVLYNTKNAIVFNEVEGITPYYSKMMITELNERLDQWTRRMPGETMENYLLRVNDSTRLEQAKVIEREVATRMATGQLEQSEINIGKYNPVTNSLVLKISTMPDIYLNVPENELNAFSQNSKLEFRNTQYKLNSNDKFELVYTEVFNSKNKKTYVFNKMEQYTLSQMTLDMDFVPLEIIQKSNMEETALMNIKDDIFNIARQKNVLSDKTNISVKTGAVNAVSADGENIVNYNVEFTYEVEESFSARDDFKPGHYHVEESNAAMTMLKIMKKAFEKDFAKYMLAGKHVRIKVKGTADASPINHTIPYNGKFGVYYGEPVYMYNELNNITLTKNDGITTNEQLAFARSLGVKYYIEKEIPTFSNMMCDYEYHIEVSKNEGSKYRRISVQYTFVDAF